MYITSPTFHASDVKISPLNPPNKRNNNAQKLELIKKLKRKLESHN